MKNKINKSPLMCRVRYLLKVFRNEILAACQPASLAKYLNVEVSLISEFVISEIRINSTKDCLEVILISEFMNPEIRITSTFRLFCQAGRLTGCQDFIS